MAAGQVADLNIGGFLQVSDTQVGVMQGGNAPLGLDVGHPVRSTGVDGEYTFADNTSVANSIFIGVVTRVEGSNYDISLPGSLITGGVPVAAAGTVYYLPDTPGADLVATVSSGLEVPVLTVLTSGSLAMIHNPVGGTSTASNPGEIRLVVADSSVSVFTETLDYTTDSRGVIVSALDVTSQAAILDVPVGGSINGVTDGTYDIQARGDDSITIALHLGSGAWLVQTLNSNSGTSSAGVPQALTEAPTIAWDVSLGVQATLSLTGDRTLQNATGTSNGERYSLVVSAQTVDRTLTFDAGYLDACGVSMSAEVIPAGDDRAFLWVGGPAGLTLLRGSSSGILGYEYTAGFADRINGSAGTTLGSNVAYTQDQASAGVWRRFGLDAIKQLANDVPYWTDPTPTSAAGVGLFGGDYMPPGFTSLFNFTESSSYNDAVTIGDLKYTAAGGSLDFSQGKPGDLAEIRFDFNIVPQVANTTVQVALIWATRDAEGNITYTFPLAAQPIFYGTGAVGKSYLNRVPITAYFASNEDVRAFALPAIKADNPVLVQPLAILNTIRR